MFIGKSPTTCWCNGAGCKAPLLLLTWSCLFSYNRAARSIPLTAQKLRSLSQQNQKSKGWSWMWSNSFSKSKPNPKHDTVRHENALNTPSCLHPLDLWLNGTWVGSDQTPVHGFFFFFVLPQGVLTEIRQRWQIQIFFFLIKHFTELKAFSGGFAIFPTESLLKDEMQFKSFAKRLYKIFRSLTADYFDKKLKAGGNLIQSIQRPGVHHGASLLVPEHLIQPGRGSLRFYTGFILLLKPNLSDVCIKCQSVAG